MDLHEYLDLVTGQMRCKKARNMVAEELRDHIEDQAEVYEEFGLSKEEAEARAVAQMGDPIEVGTDMDRIHRPRVDVRVIALVGVLTILGAIVQILMMKNAADMGDVNGTAIFLGGYFPYFASVIGNSILGFGVMLAVMFVDYSFLGKHPVAVWVGLLLLLVLMQVSSFRFYDWGLSVTNLSALHVVLLLSFASLVYFYRDKGYKGILYCLLWLLACVIQLAWESGISMSGTLCLFAASLLVISFAVQKGWFGVKKGKGQLLLWGIWGIPSAVLLTMLATGWIGGPYVKMRIQAFLNPMSAAKTSGYVTLSMRDQLSGLKLVGKSAVYDSQNWWYSLNYIMEKYGIIIGVLLLAALAFLFGKMLARMVKQQNRLGCLLGVACASILLITTVLHVLVALTLLPPTSAYLPFFADDGNAVIGCYLLLGVYLSVYRNSTILSEKQNHPKKKLSIRIENVRE